MERKRERENLNVNFTLSWQNICTLSKYYINMWHFLGYKNATGFSIYTYDTQVFYPLTDPKHLVYQHDPMSGCPASVMNITVNRVTQGIVYINKRPPGFTTTCKGADTAYTSINICEVKIMGMYSFTPFSVIIFFEAFSILPVLLSTT